MSRLMTRKPPPGRSGCKLLERSPGYANAESHPFGVIGKPVEPRWQSRQLWSPYAVVDERRILRLAHAQVLEVQRLGEAFKQPLPAAENDRRDDESQLVDEPGLERLTNDVGAPHNADILITGGF